MPMQNLKAVVSSMWNFKTFVLDLYSDINDKLYITAYKTAYELSFFVLKRTHTHTYIYIYTYMYSSVTLRRFC